MVLERQPPKDAASSLEPLRSSQEFITPPVFGRPTQLQSPLKNTSNVFNIPKANRPRPEHHRPDVPKSYGNDSLSEQDSFIDPFSFRNSKPKKEPEVVGIKLPTAPVTKPTYRPPHAMFSSLEESASSFRLVNTGRADFRTQGLFNVDAALFQDKFDDFDEPVEYIDPTKAAKDMKALLEGAFDDEDDKPRTRSRRGKLQKSEGDLAKGKRPTRSGEDAEAQHSDEDGDEEIDDGTREGLKVRLLPHQIDGVEWMLAKEKGKTKYKGYVTKGGILADDVSA